MAKVLVEYPVPATQVATGVIDFESTAPWVMYWSSITTLGSLAVPIEGR